MHVGDAAQGAQVEVVERLDVADQPDDGADDALGDEGLAADALDSLDDRAMSSSVASGDMTTTMVVPLLGGRAGHVVGAQDMQNAPRVAGALDGVEGRLTKTPARVIGRCPKK